MICDHCHRQIRIDEFRWKAVRASRDEPGHDLPACVHCAPSELDLDRFRDAEHDAEFERRRTEDMEASR